MMRNSCVFEKKITSCIKSNPFIICLVMCINLLNCTELGIEICCHYIILLLI
uniref:Uncharacterized protein n=1 Tax=Arundo donax TaxID=35708 RepID=A0A0A9ARL0_ARUDO